MAVTLAGAREETSMTDTTLNAVADLLRKEINEGPSPSHITVEYPGAIHWEHGSGGLYVIGDANDTIGGDFYLPGGMEEGWPETDGGFITDIPSESTDVRAIVDAIYAALGATSDDISREPVL
jgi:hypothetical protein